jgi:hypothetical protein
MKILILSRSIIYLKLNWRIMKLLYEQHSTVQHNHIDYGSGKQLVFAHYFCQEITLTKATRIN